MGAAGKCPKVLGVFDGNVVGGRTIREAAEKANDTRGETQATAKPNVVGIMDVA